MGHFHIFIGLTDSISATGDGSEDYKKRVPETVV
jgi:hypothetical protein